MLEKSADIFPFAANMHQNSSSTLDTFYTVCALMGMMLYLNPSRYLIVGIWSGQDMYLTYTNITVYLSLTFKACP